MAQDVLLELLYLAVTWFVLLYLTVTQLKPSSKTVGSTSDIKWLHGFTLEQLHGDREILKAMKV